MPDLTKKTTIRKGVMIPCFAFMAFIIVLGIFKNDWLKTICKSAFRFSLINFGWAYQLVAMASLVCVAVVTFSKIGNLRIGGPNARPKYSFKTWFAMALTGGISVGIVNWGVNEPMVYFGNVYGELEQLGIAPQSAEAYRFALGRCFYNWTFVPYAFYGITGLLMAYLFFNKKSKFSVAATLKPVLGKHADKTGVAAVADQRAGYKAECRRRDGNDAAADRTRGLKIRTESRGCAGAADEGDRAAADAQQRITAKHLHHAAAEEILQRDHHNRHNQTQYNSFAALEQSGNADCKADRCKEHDHEDGLQCAVKGDRGNAGRVENTVENRKAQAANQRSRNTISVEQSHLVGDDPAHPEQESA